MIIHFERERERERDLKIRRERTMRTYPIRVLRICPETLVAIVSPVVGPNQCSQKVERNHFWSRDTDLKKEGEEEEESYL